MHEYPLVKGIVDVVIEEADNASANRVTSIKLVVEGFYVVSEEAVKMYFEMLSKDTVCEGAELVFIYKEIMMECQKCGNVFEKQKNSFNCEICGTEGKLIRGKNSFYIESIEVE